MAEQVGGIYYEVSSDVSPLLNNNKRAEASLDSLGATMAQTDKASAKSAHQMTATASAVKELGNSGQKASSQLSGLTGALAGLLTVRGALGIAQMAEAYGEMAERIKMATSGSEEYDMVQQRLLQSANETYRPLREVQEVYIRTADTLRSMGYTTAQALDITDSLSLSFVKNAASADRANAAIEAVTKSVQLGRVSAQAWQTIIAATPTIINDLAASTGKATDEIRRMGVEGQITGTMLTEALRKSVDQNRQAAAEMATTIDDAFTRLKNTLSVYVGEANRATGSTQVIVKALEHVSDNIDVLAKSFMALGAGALARYITQTGLAVVSAGRQALAARAQAVANLDAAKAHVAATAAAAAHARANVGLMQASGAAAAAETAHAAAVTRLAAAQAAARAAGAGMLGLLGGPVGIVALLATAAAGMFLFRDSTDKTAVSLDGFGTSVESATEKMAKLTRSQQELTKAAASQALVEANAEIEASFGRLMGASSDFYGTHKEQIDQLVRDSKSGAISFQEMDQRLTELADTYAASKGYGDRWVQMMREAIARMSEASSAANSARTTLDNVSAAMDNAADAARNAASGIDQMNASMGATTEGGQKAIMDALKRYALIGSKGSAAGVLYDIENGLKGVGDMANYSAEELNTLKSVYKQIETAEAAAAKRRSGGRSGAPKRSKEETEAARLAKKQADDAQRYLKQLQEEADQKSSMSTTERLRYDLAAGVVKLQGEQLTQAQELAGLIDARAEAEKVAADNLSRGSAELAAQRQLQAELLDYALQIDAATLGPDAKQVYEDRARLEQKFADRVADIQARRRDAMARADAKELPRIKKLYDDQLAIELAYQGKSLAAFNDFNEKKKALDEDWRVGALRAINEYSESSRKMADQMQTVVGNAIKGLEDAFVQFAKTGKLSFADLANSIISDLARIAARQAASGIANWLGQAFGSVLGSILPSSAPSSSSQYSLAGMGGGGLGVKVPGRASGGPVEAGKMYRVNERGNPELLNVGAQQFLMMGNRSGQVTPTSGGAASSGSGGAPSVVVNINNNSQSQVTATQSRNGDTSVIDVLIEAVAGDIRSGGRVAGAMQGTYGLNRGLATPRYGR